MPKHECCAATDANGAPCVAAVSEFYDETVCNDRAALDGNVAASEMAACPLGTDDWDLDDGAPGTPSSGIAANWVDMDGTGTDGADTVGDVNNLNTGDAQAIAARIAVKWLALGLSKELCAWANPATNDDLDTCGHAQRIMQCVAPLRCSDCGG